MIPSHSTTAADTSNSNIVLGSLKQLYNYVNNLGLKTFGRFWLNQYVGPVYPGILAHKSASGWNAALFGHSTQIFEKKVGVFSNQDIDQVRIVQDPGIRKFAEENGGICTFWIGPYPVIYVTDYAISLQILKDEATKIPLNEKLSGVARADIQDVLNTTSRVQALSTLMSANSLFDMIKKAFEFANDFIETQINTSIDLSKFIHSFIENLESKMLFDFNEAPLSSYTAQDGYHALLHEFLENIIDLRMNQSKQAELAEKYEQFMIRMLRDNFKSVTNNKSNVFRKLYKQEGLDFPDDPADLGTQGEVEKNVLKRCLGIIAGSSVNTSNALNWVLRHIESNPDVKAAIIKEAMQAPSAFETFEQIENAFPFIINIVTESLRFTPIVPGLGKLVEQPYSVTINGKEIHLNRDTFILVDVIACNRLSKDHFDTPNKFDVNNMIEIKKKQKSNGIFSTLNNADSMRSFGGGNSQKAKCPGRFFTIALQAMIVANFYKNYSVKSNDISLQIQNHKASQFHMLPEEKGTLCLQKK